MKKLNLGCGLDILKGWINLDSTKLPGVDIVHDIENLPLPFKNKEFDYILCQDILEHVEYIPLLKELHRTLKKGGKLKIRVPHFTSRYNFMDPTHKKRFSIQTFDLFIKGHSRQYYFDFCFDKITDAKITFEKGKYFWNYLVELFINISHKNRKFFEATGISRIFPAANIVIKIEK